MGGEGDTLLFAHARELTCKLKPRVLSTSDIAGIAAGGTEGICDGDDDGDSCEPDDRWVDESDFEDVADALGDTLRAGVRVPVRERGMDCV